MTLPSRIRKRAEFDERAATLERRKQGAIERDGLYWENGARFQHSRDTVAWQLLAECVEALENIQNANGAPDDEDYLTTEARDMLAKIKKEVGE